MPRTSIAAIETPTPELPGDRLVPRQGMPEEVSAIFREIVSLVPVGHFRRSDTYVLESYAQAIYTSRKAYADLQREGGVMQTGKLNPLVAIQEKSDRTICALSARLRLAPQQRTDPKTTGRQRFTSSAYAAFDEGNDDE